MPGKLSVLFTHVDFFITLYRDMLKRIVLESSDIEESLWSRTF